MYTLSPVSSAPPVTASISMVISASSAKAESDITGGVAADSEVFSPWSIVSLVERIDVPDSLMSTVVVPDVEPAPVSDALTSVTVKANGILNVTFAVPVVKAVVSSDAAMTNDWVTKLLIVDRVNFLIVTGKRKGDI